MSSAMGRKFALIGGGGVRTPLVIFGLNEAANDLGADELTLYDPDADRLRIMAELGRAIVARENGSLRVREARSIEDAVDGADFVMNSIRIGGIARRAADERAAIKHGYPGQETTGPVGAAMALRTVPIAIEQARTVARLSPTAWIVNFTNPAGLITQAITQRTEAKVVGICDTPAELFHNIAHALGGTKDEVECDYVGLNHLGWVRGVRFRGRDVMEEVLASDTILSKLYTAALFDFEMIRALRLIPTEYLFFYYCRQRAYANQCKQGSSRGTEVERLNHELIITLSKHLGSGDADEAVAAYAAYLNRRSGSYMRLEGSAGSAFDADATFHVDPFRVASGYHRMAIDVMLALTGARPQRIVVNTLNRGALTQLRQDDVVEVPCEVSKDRIAPPQLGSLPDAVLGLVQSVKAYERAAIEAARTSSKLVARKALLIHPAIAEWEPSASLLNDLWNPTCIHC